MKYEPVYVAWDGWGFSLSPIHMPRMFDLGNSHQNISQTTQVLSLSQPFVWENFFKNDANNDTSYWRWSKYQHGWLYDVMWLCDIQFLCVILFLFVRQQEVIEVKCHVRSNANGCGWLETEICVLRMLVEPIFQALSILAVVHYGVHVHILKENNKAAGGWPSTRSS